MSDNYPTTYTLRLEISHIANLPPVHSTDKVQVIIRDAAGRVKTALIGNLANIEAQVEADPQVKVEANPRAEVEASRRLK